MIEYEYKIVTKDDINKFGKQGFQVIQVIECFDKFAFVMEKQVKVKEDFASTGRIFL